MTENPSPAGDSLPDVTEEWSRAFAWIEQELGGRIVAARRQPRWRPAWFIDLERGGERIPLYFRGQRGEIKHGFEALEFEVGLLRKLEREGIPVPHVYAMCPDPGGIVMARSPGQANLATANDDAQRAAVLSDYVDILARMHGLDPAGFAGLGLRESTGEDALGLGDFESWVKGYRRGRVRPEPEIEFLIGWLMRNVPRGRSRASFVCADAGQFLFEGDSVTALIDLELAYIGDPAADLGSLRCRDLSEPLGPLAPAIARYEANVGERIERSVIDYHTVRFATCTPLAVAPMLARVIPGLDYAQYLTWNFVYSKTPLEVIADGMGLELEVLSAPEPEASRHSPGYGALLGMLSKGASEASDANGSPAASAFEGYARDTAQRVAEYLARVDQLAPQIESENLDDFQAVFGTRPARPAECDAELESAARKAGPESDETLLPLLHRRLQRQGWLLEPILREYRGAKMQRLD